MKEYTKYIEYIEYLSNLNFKTRSIKDDLLYIKKKFEEKNIFKITKYSIDYVEFIFDKCLEYTIDKNVLTYSNFIRKDKLKKLLND